MQEAMKKRAIELMSNGSVNRVLGWKIGEFVYDTTPYVFMNEGELETSFVYNDFCVANLSKYLVKESENEGRILVFLKPCDTYSFNQLMSEHRVCREKVYICGVECECKIDIERLRQAGISGIISAERDGELLVLDTIYGKKDVTAKDFYAQRCIECKSRKSVVYDEFIGADGDIQDTDRFYMVERIEAMSAEARFEFWRSELSRCIRCNACRDICPACTCEKCIFSNPDSGFENKAAADPFEQKLFHIIRAFHVAGRCTDCGECTRVCPEHIPLHLLNRKFIKDINKLYGEYQAGAEVNERGPLVSYSKNDVDPADFSKGGADK